MVRPLNEKYGGWTQLTLTPGDLKDTALVVNYLDDVWIISQTKHAHMAMVKDVVFYLKELGFKLSPKKAKLGLRDQRIQVLGVEIYKNMLFMPENKCSMFCSFKRPRTRRDVMKLVGHLVYLGAFVHKFSELTAPLTDLLQGGDKIVWTERQEEAVRKLEKIVTCLPPLATFNRLKTLIICTDATTIATAYTAGHLLQLEGMGEEQFVPILHGGMKLRTNQGLAPSVCELYAIIHAFKKTRTLINQASSVLLMTDSRSVKLAVAHSLNNTIYSQIHDLLLQMQEVSAKILLTSFSDSESTFVDYLSRLDARPKLRAAINMLTDPDLDNKMPVKSGEFYVTDLDHIKYEMLNDPQQMNFMIKHAKDTETFRGYWNVIKERDSEAPWFKRIHDKMMEKGLLSLRKHDFLELGKPPKRTKACNNTGTVGNPTVEKEKAVAEAKAETGALVEEARQRGIVCKIEHGQVFVSPTPDEISKAQRTHYIWSHVIRKLENGGKIKGYSLYNGLLMRLKHKNQPEGEDNIYLYVIPDKSMLEHKILLGVHRLHSGARKAAKMLEYIYCIPNISRKLVAISAACQLCASWNPYTKANADRRKLTVRKGYTPMQLFAIDHVEMQKFGAYTCMLVCIDSASRHIFITACKTQKANETIKALENIFNTIGRYPKGLLCDNATGLGGSAAFRKFLKRRNIQMYRSTPFKSTSNSQVESANNSVRILINKLAKEYDTLNWPELTGRTMFLLNNVPRKILKGKSPGEVFYGHPPLSANDLFEFGEADEDSSE
jgi:hypothetical protein